MISTNKKPVFNSSDQSKFVCRDHLVTGEEFEISEAEEGLLKTLPVPENLASYYESEDYISHNDSKNSLQDKLYHLVKAHMLSQKSKWISSYFKKGKILDFGAGTGEFLNKMKSLDWKVEGVEPNKNARNLAILKGVDLKSGLSKLTNSEFDIISLWHVLEHLPDLNNKIKEFYELLGENGILIIAVPNHNSYDAQYYKENWAAWDVPRHLWHFSRNGLKEKFLKFGLELIDEKPLKFDSYYVSMLSEKNKNSSGNLINAFYRGYISNLRAKNSGEYSSIAYFFKKSPKT